VRKLLTLTEYGCITSADVAPSFDEQSVSQADFEWLSRIGSSGAKQSPPLFRRESEQRLRVSNYVGVVETPNGTTVEILPKHHEGDVPVERTRHLLHRMIAAALDLPVKETGVTHLQLFSAPLSEWVARHFLDALDRLIKRGLRFDYLRLEEEQPYLRGQLDLARQLRQAPGRAHYFQLRHDVFSPDGPENRLLKSALTLVASHTQDAENWRLAHELLVVLHEVPKSARYADDFKRWQRGRLLAHYEPVRPWCELILGQQMPLSVHGNWQGVSMLFPMEKLYERYVESAVRHGLRAGASLTAQAASESLCRYQDAGFFRLRPDMLVQSGAQRWILDAKWKRLDAADTENRFGLAQADFYQLFAYGQKYLGGIGELYLVYPRTASFSAALGPFAFSDSLKLWAVPFDLESQRFELPLPFL
jgi:5-methylcytosine-specific restriction enzyme subunit McrC